MDEKTRVQILFLRRPQLFTSMVSLHYPFTIEELRKYSNVIDWTLLSSNRNIKWDLNLINEFELKFNFYLLLINASLDWQNGIELILKDRFIKSLEDRNRYKDNKPSSQKEFDKIIDKHKGGISKLKVAYRDYLYDGNKDAICYKSPKHYDTYVSVVTDEISETSLINGIFGSELDEGEYYHSRFDRYEHYTECCNFGCHHKVKLSQQLLEICEEKLNWKQISLNSTIPFTAELLKQFFEYWDFNLLGKRIDIDWSIELIEIGINKWNRSSLDFNPVVWKILSPYIEIDWLSYLPILVEEIETLKERNNI
jgi:hypothetical protein